MDVQIIVVPYDSGLRSRRMGAGPEAVLPELQSDLKNDSHKTEVIFVEAETKFQTEISTSFQLYREVSRVTRQAIDGARFPVVLSGNCGAAIGAISGLNANPVALLWFDAHGDYNTPETTKSGFLDGMCLSVATGDAWQNLATSIERFKPLPESAILHIGARDFDPQELQRLQNSEATILSVDRLRSSLKPTIDQYVRGLPPGKTAGVYVHVDLDVLDPEIAPANQYAVSGGITPQELCEVVKLISEVIPVKGCGIASYDPSVDAEGKGVAAAVEIVRCILRSAKVDR